MISRRNEFAAFRSSASSFSHCGSQNAVHVSGLSFTRSVFETSVMYQESPPTPVTLPSSSVRT